MRGVVTRVKGAGLAVTTILRNSIYTEIVFSGRRIAGTVAPVLVIALKRNGAYPADIQLFTVGGCSRCLKVE
jgi:hypothetical protein